jgi:Lipocalin-like domain
MAKHGQKQRAESSRARICAVSTPIGTLQVLNFSEPVPKYRCVALPPEAQPGRAGLREGMRSRSKRRYKEEAMNRHLLSVCAIAALALAVLPSASVAQQKSMKDQLVGTWTLLLNDYVKADGTHVPAFGPNPTGSVVFSPDGHYSLQIMRASLPKFASSNRYKGTTDENKAVVGGIITHFGTFSVNDADKSLTFRIESSSFPNWSGTQQKRLITALTDDVLTYTTPNPSVDPSTNVRSELVWRRAK